MSGLSGWYLIRLANRGQFSLALRAEWQRRVGWDPYNQERYAFYKSVAKMFFNWGVLSGLISLLALAFSTIPEGQDPSQWLFSVWIGKTMLSGVVIMILSALWLALIKQTIGKKGGSSYSRETRINIHFARFLEWTGYSPEQMAKYTIEVLCDLATKVLVDCAYERIKHDELPAANDDGVPTFGWARRASDLDTDMTEKYNILHELGLASDGYTPYFTQARIRRAGDLSSRAKAATNTESQGIHESVD